MNLQIKSLSGELSEEEKKYLRKKFLWFEEHLPNSAILTAGVREHITKKSNQAFEVILHLIIPGAKKPIYSRVFRNTFTEAVDLSRKKIERVVVRGKNQKKFSFRLKLPGLKFLGRRGTNGTT